jgi:hypothetical protein
MWWWTFGLHKILEISWLSEDLLASQEGLCSLELVSKLVSYLVSRQYILQRNFHTVPFQRHYNICVLGHRDTIKGITCACLISTSKYLANFIDMDIETLIIFKICLYLITPQILHYSFRALSTINSKFEQQNALSFFLKGSCYTKIQKVPARFYPQSDHHQGTRI